MEVVGMSGKFENDYYIVDENFRLLSFNQSVKERYKGIKIGDLCYKVIMNRESHVFTAQLQETVIIAV